MSINEGQLLLIEESRIQNEEIDTHRTITIDETLRKTGALQPDGMSILQPLSETELYHVDGASLQ